MKNATGSRHSEATLKAAIEHGRYQSNKFIECRRLDGMVSDRLMKPLTYFSSEFAGNTEQQLKKSMQIDRFRILLQLIVFVFYCS